MDKSKNDNNNSKKKKIILLLSIIFFIILFIVIIILIIYIYKKYRYTKGYGIHRRTDHLLEVDDLTDGE